MKKPSPPSEPRQNPPRPVTVTGQLDEEEEIFYIKASSFYKICRDLRINKLIGPAAADALEAAAGRGQVSEQGAPAKQLRSKVASNRDVAKPKEEPNAAQESKDVMPEVNVEEKKPKKRIMQFHDEAEEIPELKESFEEKGKSNEVEAQEEEKGKKAEAEPEEEPELNLNPKQNKMRTEFEMWLMDKIPELFGVDDSDELPESLQEDGQALIVTHLIADTSEDTRRARLERWLEVALDVSAKEAFVTELIMKAQAINDAGQKKKKKKENKFAE